MNEIRYGMSAEERLLEKIFGEKPREDGCSGCYFRGKTPILELYPKDGEGYPFRDRPELCGEDGVRGLYEAVEGWLEYSLSEDWKSREAAQDMLIQMEARIESYLDEHMEKLDPEKMARFQAGHMSRTFGRLRPEKYKEVYDKIMARYEEEDSDTVISDLDEIAAFTAKEKARWDMVDRLRDQLKQAKAEIRALSDDKGMLAHRAKTMTERCMATEMKYSRQVKEMTKELKAMEHRLKEMEERRTFGIDEDDGK